MEQLEAWDSSALLVSPRFITGLIGHSPHPSPPMLATPKLSFFFDATQLPHP